MRLHGIDAPEHGQPWSTAAQRAASHAVFGRTVNVAIRDTDRYGRTIGVVYTKAAEPLNAALVRAGLAWAYTEYSRDYTAQEAEARKARRGLWSDPAPVPPWTWRKGKTASSIPRR